MLRHAWIIALGMATVAQAQPDPVALLRSVPAAREGWHGEVTMRMEMTMLRPRKGEQRIVQL
jgi:hypothetical protein